MATNTGPSISNGITVKTAPHEANLLGSRHGQPVTNAETLLHTSCRKTPGIDCKELLQTSFDSHLNNQSAHAALYASTNGFVQGAIKAYNQHHHFIIRPEDVWFAILTQFSCYVNAHSEELRDKFVAHEGQKDLVINMVGDRYTVDYGWFAEAMGRLLEKSVVDPELRKWIVPEYTTTTAEDTVVASVLMMGTLQKYFTYECCIECGLPSVTILGTEGDWENILLRLEKLKTYGKEPTMWYDLLEPVLSKFIETFQSPDSEGVLDFWQKIAHEYNMGSGPTELSGWITAFCMWDSNGKLLFRGRGSKAQDQGKPGVFDAGAYHRVDISDVPPGYGSVPVKVDDNGDLFDATMVAGSMAIKGTSSGKPLENGQVGLDTMQPVSGWWMFEKSAEDGRAMGNIG